PPTPLSKMPMGRLRSKVAKRRSLRLLRESPAEYRRPTRRLREAFFDRRVMRSLQLCDAADSRARLIVCLSLTRWQACAQRSFFYRREITPQWQDRVDRNDNPLDSD